MLKFSLPTHNRKELGAILIAGMSVMSSSMSYIFGNDPKNEDVL